MNRRATLSLAGAWLLFWALMVATAIQDFLRHDDHGPLWQPILWESSSMVVASLLLAMQRLATRRHDTLLATPAPWFARQALWLPVWWILFTPLAFGIRHGVYALLGAEYQHEPWGETLLYENVKISVFVIIFTLITFGVLSYRAAEQANANWRTAQLHQLTQQMQPHFLFNALNTISSLMHTDVERADATLVQLADVLRATLDVSGQQQAPLSTELRLLRGYARLMEERFADRVQIVWEIDAACSDCLVPVMSMQPLLENVFKHTVERRRGVTKIAISAKRDSGALLLTVSDDAGHLAAHGTDSGVAVSGIGVRNLRERLQALHGEQATLQLRQLAPAGVRAQMRLPCVS
ncbi:MULTISPECIES: sensor histidine kinase [unclassified Duganella]|uniref:sensor histidine kinase n=1 Tax=unclassified Duganella TaxID=2636909 RepID=UPI0006FC326F|nr:MULTISPECIES: histidine kinase [unclassified Duganella]KQV61822.1 sensor protein LytS [Duganella sp. Root336D2]KRB84328.1 sensor protein LytS [Duganella sp. Root198D2]